jgi:AcrR family transcriptional regulator
MGTRERWLDAGLDVLADSGPAALTIESLSLRLGLSKGSFYHHFGGMPGYRRALLEHFEARENRAFLDRAEAAPVAAGEERLRFVVDDAMAAEGGRPRLEDAVRGWASSDPLVREYLDRIDRTRVAFLQREFAAMALDERTAADFAEIAHLMAIGAAHTLPPASPERIVRLWDRLLRLARDRAATG